MYNVMCSDVMAAQNWLKRANDCPVNWAKTLSLWSLGQPYCVSTSLLMFWNLHPQQLHW